MDKQVFDKLDDLLHVQYCDRVLVIFNDPPLVRMRQHLDDEEVKRIPFLTYVGGNNKEELKDIAMSFEMSDFQIRQRKRTQYSFELKIRGLSFQQMQKLVRSLT